MFALEATLTRETAGVITAVLGAATSKDLPDGKPGLVRSSVNHFSHLLYLGHEDVHVQPESTTATESRCETQVRGDYAP